VALDQGGEVGGRARRGSAAQEVAQRVHPGDRVARGGEVGGETAGGGVPAAVAGIEHDEGVACAGRRRLDHGHVWRGEVVRPRAGRGGDDERGAHRGGQGGDE